MGSNLRAVLLGGARHPPLPPVPPSDDQGIGSINCHKLSLNALIFIVLGNSVTREFHGNSHSPGDPFDFRATHSAVLATNIDSAYLSELASKLAGGQEPVEA